MLRIIPLLLLFVIRIAFVSVGEGRHYAFGLLAAVSRVLWFVKVPSFFRGKLITLPSGEVELPLVRMPMGRLLMVVIPFTVGILWRRRFEHSVLSRVKLEQMWCNLSLMEFLSCCWCRTGRT